MHVILEALSELEESEKKEVFLKKTRTMFFYVPRNKIWTKLQQIELQSQIEIKEIEVCEKYWKTLSDFVNLYLSSAIELYEKAQVDTFENSEAQTLLNHAKWNHQMSLDTAKEIEDNFKLMKKRILEHDKQLMGDPDFDTKGTSIWSTLLGK